jgi:hypothetical protein
MIYGINDHMIMIFFKWFLLMWLNNRYLLTYEMYIYV